MGGLMGGWTLAIDFGTSFTTAAILADGRAELLEFDNSRYLPSAVFLDDDGQLLVGRHALNRAEVFPERVERCPKRALVAGPAVRLGGQDVPVTDLVAALLRRVYDEAARRQGAGSLELVLLTHPARWGPWEIGLLGKAAAKAGLPEPRFVSEPVAAATYYAHARPVAAGACVAVYDLGGGTFDTAVLRRADGGFELAGPPGGHDRLGGEDFDAALLELIGDHAEAADPRAWETLMTGEGRAQSRARVRLRRDVTEAKHALSERLATSVLPDGHDDELRLTRAEFEERIARPLKESVDELLATVARAGLGPADLAAVHLTGGSSRIPRISDLLAETLGALPVVEGDPKGVVALGALQTARPAPEAARPATAATPVSRPAAGSPPARPRTPRPVADPAPAPWLVTLRLGLRGVLALALLGLVLLTSLAFSDEAGRVAYHARWHSHVPWAYRNLAIAALAGALLIGPVRKAGGRAGALACAAAVAALPLFTSVSGHNSLGIAMPSVALLAAAELLRPDPARTRKAHRRYVLGYALTVQVAWLGIALLLYLNSGGESTDVLHYASVVLPAALGMLVATPVIWLFTAGAQVRSEALRRLAHGLEHGGRDGLTR